MALCPRCQSTNAAGARACTECGGWLQFALDSGPELPLPEPMLEPVITPVGPPPDSKPLADVLILTLPLSRPVRPGRAADPPPEPEPAPTLVLEPSARDQASSGTLPAIPALADHPMNALPDAPAGKPDLVEQTVPATAPADKNPTAPPPSQLRPRLVVLRGQKINAEYPVYEGRNTVGRFADKPVDIDLVSQESETQIWCSRQHAAITFDKGAVLIEDLNSLNGTWVNGVRIHPGQLRVLKANDIVQIGTVQMKLLLD